MEIFYKESNKTIRVNAGEDLTAYTEIELVFKKTDDTIATKTLSASEVAVGLVEVTETVNGIATTFSANEYVNYITEVDFINATGTWWVQLIAINTATSPDTNYVGDPTKLIVKPRLDNT